MIKPAHLYTDTSTQIDYRCRYDDDEGKLAEVNRLRSQMGCQCCISSDMIAGVLVCKETGQVCDRVCGRFWVSV